MHVAVAIVGYRNADDVLNCLAALARSDHTAFEVVICENGGADACRELAARAPKALAGGQKVSVIAATSNLGYAGGINRCLAHASEADAWWILNPDTEPHPETLAALLAPLQRGEADAVGGTTHFMDGVVQQYGGAWNGWLARAESIGYGAQVSDPVDKIVVERRLDFLSGASMLVGRRFLEAVGPMRDDYFLYCEEVEWCLRGIQKGMRLGFAPDAKVPHHQGTTTGSVADIRLRPRMPVYLDTRNRILVTRDRFPGRLPVAALAVLLVALLRFGRRGAWKQLGYATAGWMAGLTGERGAPAWFDA